MVFLVIVVNKSLDNMRPVILSVIISDVVVQYRYIENIKVFKIYEIIADIKLIYVTYRIFSSTVK